MLRSWVLPTFSLWTVALCLSAVGAPSRSEPEACIAYDGSQFFDLNPLRSKTDYEVVSDVGTRNITFNVCGGVVSETWKLEDQEHVAGFYRGPHSDLSIGAVNTTVSIAHGHPLLVMTGGSVCGAEDSKNDSPLKRSSVIRFICDQTVFSKGTPRLVAQLPPDDDSACAFFIEWRTHVACATSKPGGSGGPILVFGVIVFVAIFAYVVAATLYNRMVLGLRGWEQLPSFSFCSFASVRGFLAACLSRSRAGYQHEPSWGSWRRDRSAFGRLPNEEEASMVNSRFSIDEDDEGARDHQILDSGVPPPGIHEGVIRL